MYVALLNYCIMHTSNNNSNNNNNAPFLLVIGVLVLTRGLSQWAGRGFVAQVLKVECLTLELIVVHCLGASIYDI